MDDFMGIPPSTLLDIMEKLAGPDPRMQEYITKLPRLDEKRLKELDHHESSCPICLTAFAALLAEEEMALAMDSPAYAAQDHGVTRLKNVVPEEEGCGHVFCRKDISKWIATGHHSCPSCRRPFLPSIPSAAGDDAGATLQESFQRLANGLRLDGGDTDEFEHLLRQINRDNIFPLGHGRTAGPATASGGQRSTRRNDYDDYAGMYS